MRLARGLLSDAEIFLFDEPFNGIDVGTRAHILAFIQSHLKQKTLVLATHDRSKLAMAERVYEMRGGSLVSST